MPDFSTVVVTQATQVVTLTTIQQVVRVNSSTPGSYADVEAFLQMYHGTGSPEGVVTAPVSALYRQTDGTEEVTRWVKARGTGNTGWVLVDVGVAVPSGFTGWVPFTIARENRAFTVKESVTQFKGTGTTYYVGFSGASDSNPGTSRAASFASLNKAYTMTDYDVIIVNAGLYDRNVSTVGTPTRSHSLIGEGGDAILSRHVRTSTMSWSLQSGTCYKATVSATVQVVCDARYPDEFGDYARCALVADIATCVSTVQSWYYDSGTTTLYVNLPDGREPDADIRVYRNGSHVTIESGITMYLENIRLEGGQTPLLVDNTTGAGGSNRPTCYAKNCRFSYAGDSNGATVRGGITWFEDCVAAHNYLDGFNYHVDVVACDTVEVGCQGYDNGYNPAAPGINNGSTTHDGNAILRVNGTYHDNEGPNVVDVGSPVSWNLGCRSYASRATTADEQVSNFYVSGGSMWLDHCDSEASTYDFVTTSGGTIYTRECADLQAEFAGSDVQDY